MFFFFILNMGTSTFAKIPYKKKEIWMAKTETWLLKDRIMLVKCTASYCGWMWVNYVTATTGQKNKVVTFYLEGNMDPQYKGWDDDNC